MRVIFFFVIFWFFAGCKTVDNCEAYSQCDELYMSDYNCEVKPLKLTIPAYYGTPANVYPYYSPYYYGSPPYGSYYYRPQVPQEPVNTQPQTQPQTVRVAKRPNIWSGSDQGRGRD